jgi:ssRNA-specific RNase YbeY (16S rRNA maturation enzyme)
VCKPDLFNSDMISFSSNLKFWTLHTCRLYRDVQLFLDYLGIQPTSPLLIGIQFVGPRLMQRLNKEYRGKDKPTDILTFELFPELLKNRKNNESEMQWFIYLCLVNVF